MFLWVQRERKKMTQKNKKKVSIKKWFESISLAGGMEINWEIIRKINLQKKKLKFREIRRVSGRWMLVTSNHQSETHANFFNYL
jgi:hypothetical protein